MEGLTPKRQDTAVIERRWLSEKTFELDLTRPAGIRHVPGQWIRLFPKGEGRDYTLVNAPSDPNLTVCIRRIRQGGTSDFLAGASMGTPLRLEGPSGYFAHRTSPRPAVFIATGTGVAPFVSMARAGVTGFTLLHGTGSERELYYGDLFRTAAARYIPCISAATLPAESSDPVFRGRVTDYLNTRLPEGVYDFYLCGTGEMIREATAIIDDLFEESKLYIENFD